MEIPSLPTQSPFVFFPVYFSLHRLNAWNSLSVLSLLRPLFSVHRILEYPGAVILISRIGRNVIFLSHRRVSPFSRGLIFTRARVSLALLSVRKIGGLLVVYFTFVSSNKLKTANSEGFRPSRSLESVLNM